MPSDVLVSRLGAELVDALNTDGFASALVRSLHQLTPLDAAIVAAFPACERPRILHDDMGRRDTQSRGAYLHGLYKRDAVYRACQDAISQGFYRYRELSRGAERVGPCTARHDADRLIEEATFVSPVPGRGHLVFSVYRSPGRGEFTAEDCLRLRTVAPLVNRALAKHWPQLGRREAEDRLEHAIEASRSMFDSAKLSRREREIASLILRGHSSLSAAHRLGIAEGTVKNHRKSIYAKLAISSQAELFRGVLSNLPAG